MKLLSKQVVRVDSSGDGHFHASRTGHVHQGIDLEAKQGEPIFAPFNGTVTRIVKPYAAGAGAKSALSGFDFEGSNQTVRIFYGKAIQVGSSFSAGEVIGRVENVATYYGTSMLNHIHVELRDAKNAILDPTAFLENLKKK